MRSVTLRFARQFDLGRINVDYQTRSGHLHRCELTDRGKSFGLFLPTADQLDDLLAHLFSRVLIPAFEHDVRDDKDADQKQRWGDMVFTNTRKFCNCTKKVL